MNKVRIRPEWDDPIAREALDKARRDNPDCDRVWREGLQRMADEIDQRAFERISRDHFFALLNMQRTGDEVI